VAVFFGTFENKVDRKGRVSVPAPFRQALGQSAFQGIIARPSYRSQAVEACDIEFMEQLNNSVATNDLYSDAHEDLAFTIFADSHQLSFDGEGRILLPPALVEHAGIGERAGFVGMGSSFQIWEPDTLQQQKAEARARARAQGLTLPLRRDSGDPR
jgi:MraZ protein